MKWKERSRKKKEERIERLGAYAWNLLHRNIQSPVLFITDQRESMSYVIYYPVFFTKHRNESLTSIFITFPNPVVLLVTRVIESSISLSYCKLCLIAVLPSKRMGFKPTHINFRVHVISYLTRLYMTQSHFSSVHQTT